MAEQEKTLAQLPKRLRYKWLLVCLIIFLLLLSIFPVVIRYVAQNWLLEHGAQQAVIDDVDLNIFAGTFGLSGVDIIGQHQGGARLETLIVNLSMLGLLQKRIDVEKIEIHGVNIDVVQTGDASIIIAGMALPAGESKQAEDGEESGWGLGLGSVVLDNIQVNLNTPKLNTKLLVPDLELGSMASWLPQQSTSYGLHLEIDDASLAINGQLTAFSEQPVVTAKIQIDRLALSLFAGLVENGGIDKLSGYFSLASDIKLELKPGGGLVASMDGSLNVDRLVLEKEQYQINVSNLSWQGSLGYLASESEVDIGLRSRSDVVVKGILISDGKAGVELAEIDTIKLKAIGLEKDQKLVVSSVEVDELKALSQEAQKVPLVNIGDVVASDLRFDGASTVELDSIMMQGLNVAAVINKTGTIEVISQLMASAGPLTNDTASETVADNSSDVDEPFVFRLKRFEVKGDNKISFVDTSVKPNYTVMAAPLHLLVTDIDTGNSQNDINIELDATVNEFETIAVKAKARPFGEKLNLTAESTVTSLELPPLSPYAGKYSGYRPKQGKLNAEIKVSVVDGQLDSKIKMKLNKFHLQAADQQKVDAMTKSLAMPLDVALDLLRDNDDNVFLDLEVRGDINNPKFDIRKVINRAMVKSTQMAVTAYLKFALQPWSSLLTVAEIGGKAMELSFESVIFVPGQIEPAQQQHDYLNKIAAMLNDRPGITLNICGQASDADNAILLDKEKPEAQVDMTEDERNDRLIKFATERAQVVRRYFVAQGVDQARLFVCQPVIDKPLETPPSVALFL